MDARRLFPALWLLLSACQRNPIDCEALAVASSALCAGERAEDCFPAECSPAGAVCDREGREILGVQVITVHPVILASAALDCDQALYQFSIYVCDNPPLPAIVCYREAYL